MTGLVIRVVRFLGVRFYVVFEAWSISVDVDVDVDDGEGDDGCCRRLDCCIVLRLCFGKRGATRGSDVDAASDDNDISLLCFFCSGAVPCCR